MLQFHYKQAAGCVACLHSLEDFEYTAPGITTLGIYHRLRAISSSRAAISASIWQALCIGYCSGGLAASQLCVCVCEVFQDSHRASKLSVAVQQAYELYFACFRVLKHVAALLQGGAGAVHTPYKVSCAVWHSLKDVQTSVSAIRDTAVPGSCAGWLARKIAAQLIIATACLCNKCGP